MPQQGKNSQPQTESERKVDKHGGSQVKNSNNNRCVRLVIKPLRIFQFIVVLSIFVLIIYAIVFDDANVSSVKYIFLLVISGAYVFILAVDLISQFSGGELYAIPMFLCSLLGVLLYAIAGLALIATFAATELGYILAMLCLCFLLCLLFTIDSATILTFWKRQCNLCKQCCYTNQGEMLFQKGLHDTRLHPETVKHDLTTSISNVKVPSSDESINEHSYRKVGYGHRRQYVDCPTNSPSNCVLEMAEVQTDAHKTTTIESQTQHEIKEKPAQTVSRCELCNRQIQLFSSMEHPQSTVPQAACAPCPALVQLIRGTPCCPGCRCVAGIVQVSSKSQQQQTQRQDQKQDKKWSKEQEQGKQSKDDKSHGMMTSGTDDDTKLTGVSGTITKPSLASCCLVPYQKTNSPCQTARGDDAKAIKKYPELVEQRKAKVKEMKIEKGKEKCTKEQCEILIPKGEKLTTPTKTRTKDTPTESPKMLKEKTTKSVPEKKPETSETCTKKSVQNELSKPPIDQTTKLLPKTSKPLVQTGSLAKKPSEADTESVKFIKEPVKESVEQPVNETVKQSGKEPATEPIKFIKEPVEEAVKEFVKEPVKKSVKEPVKESIKEPVKKSVEESGKEPVKESKGPNRSKKNEIPTSVPPVIPPQEERQMIDRLDQMKGTPEEKKESEKKKDQSKKKSETLRDTRSAVDTSKTGNEKLSISSAYSSDSETSSDSLIDNEVTGFTEKSSAKEPDEKIEVKKDKISLVAATNTVSGTRTQATDTDQLTGKLKRTHIFPRKNKVEPTEQIYTDTSNQTLDAGDYDETQRLNAERKRHLPESQSLTICPSCKRVQGVTTTTTFQYYCIYKDKRGRVFCEFCFSPNSIKVVHKSDGNEHKRLRCTGCGNFLRVKCSQSEGTRNNCPKCGQTQPRSSRAVVK